MSKNEVKEFNVFGNVYGVSLWRSGMSVIFDMLDDQAGNKENSELHEYKQALNQEGEYSLKINGKFNPNSISSSELFNNFVADLKDNFLNEELEQIGFSKEWLMAEHNKLVEIAINLNSNSVEIEL